MNSINAKTLNIEKNLLPSHKKKVDDNVKVAPKDVDRDENYSDVDIGTWQAYSGVITKDAVQKSVSREDVFKYLNAE